MDDELQKNRKATITSAVQVLHTFQIEGHSKFLDMFDQNYREDYKDF
jgi:hypothetical protein